MRLWFWLTFLFCGCGSATSTGPQPADEWLTVRDAGVTIEYAAADAQWAAQLLSDAKAGRALITQFFSLDTLADIRVQVYPDRSTMEPAWRTIFNAPNMKFQCWMIANASRQLVVMLSPRVWAAQTCGHSATDARYVARMVTHELVHMLHRRVLSDASVNGFGGNWWWIEGLAVYASGQFDAGMAAHARQGLSQSPPASLATMMETNFGYAFAGSVVAYIDRTRGRSPMIALTFAPTADALFSMLGVSSGELFEAWHSAMGATGAMGAKSGYQ